MLYYTNWHTVYDEEFPEENDETETLRREAITTIQVPKEITSQGNYCIKLEVVTESEEYSRGWSFEGFSITQKVD